MTDAELLNILLETVVYLGAGIVLSLFTAFTNKKEDKYWWALFSLFFPVFFIVLQIVSWVLKHFSKEN